MQHKNFLRIALVTASLLLIPILGSMFVEGWNWGFFDFVFAGILIFGIGFLFELAREKAAGNNNYKLAAGVALGTTFLLVWINAAVGIIHNDNGSNLFYLLTLALGFVSAFLLRFEPQGMARVMLGIAITLTLIPLLGLFIWREEMIAKPHGLLGVFLLNSIFVGLFLFSAFLFRRASTTEPK